MMIELCKIIGLFLFASFFIIPIFLNLYKERMWEYICKKLKEEQDRKRKKR